MLYVAADFGDMDSQRSFFVESGRRATRYIRVVRIGFVKPFDGRDVVVERPLEVNYVTIQHLAPPTPHIILRAKVVERPLEVNYVTFQHLPPSPHASYNTACKGRRASAGGQLRHRPASSALWRSTALHRTFSGRV